MAVQEPPTSGDDFPVVLYRTKKLPATAKMQEGPSISRVSAYSMGVGALGRQVGASGSSANGEATSGLTRFLGGARKQQGEAISGTPQTAGPADLDRVRESIPHDAEALVH